MNLDQTLLCGTTDVRSLRQNLRAPMLLRAIGRTMGVHQYFWKIFSRNSAQPRWLSFLRRQVDGIINLRDVCARVWHARLILKVDSTKTFDDFNGFRAPTPREAHEEVSPLHTHYIYIYIYMMTSVFI